MRPDTTSVCGILYNRRNAGEGCNAGTTGTLLNEAEIQQTRAASKKFPWIKPAPAVLQEADELFGAGKKDEARTLYRALASLPQPEARGWSGRGSKAEA